MSRAEAGTGTVRVTDLAVSIIRTWVPIAVGAAITWMCARTGLVVTDSWTILAAVWAQAGVTAAYYAAARYLERRAGAGTVAVVCRWVGRWMLGGVIRQPVYTAPPTSAVTLVEPGGVVRRPD